jgi:hypothetical protein
MYVKIPTFFYTNDTDSHEKRELSPTLTFIPSEVLD